ncbi:unnamed protein product [Scytosiphon promiscuus]
MTAAAGDGMVPSGQAPSVCVIGAGAAGLAAARILRDEGCLVRVLEKSHDVGGVWRYKTEPDAKAPMYRSLVTNLPNETMSYFGFPFPEENQSYTTHGEVLDYLCSFADEHDLHPLISLGCPVESVRPADASASDAAAKPSGGDGGRSRGHSTAAEAYSAAASAGDGGVSAMSGENSDRSGNDGPRKPNDKFEGTVGKWEVVYRQGRAAGAAVHTAGGAAGAADATATTHVTEVFDAVCVCSGHYDEPSVPPVESLKEFRGTSMHSKEYDRPDVEAFIGKRVLCVGSRSSGADIAREVSSVADVVHVCDRKNLTSRQGGEKGNVWWRPGLERFEGTNGVRFKDGELQEVDTVVWATGYSYDFPFLEGSGLLTEPVSERVHPLYEQLFHVQHPSLSFVGLPQSVVPFPLFEIQANAVAAAITGRASFPQLAEREQWLLDEEHGLRERGIDPTSRAVHVLGGKQWDYLRRLVRLASDPGTVAHGPRTKTSGAAVSAEVGGHTGGGEEEEDGRSSRAPPLPLPSRPGSVGSSTDAPRQHAAALEGLLKMVGVKEAIYNDAGESRPSFPGAPDDYRRREYDVDWESGEFTVSFADRKANGEGPSSLAVPSGQ